MMRRHLIIGCAAASALALSSTVLSAAPGEPAGATIKVVNKVTAEFERDMRDLATGDAVRQEEMIAVGSDAVGELKLLDDTKLALGPGSKLKLDKFVYDPSKSKGAVVLDLVKGTFRFITGTAEKPAYVIKTPGAAITVRGTIFDLFIDDSGLTWVLLHEGAVTVCNTRGKCRDLDEPGRLLRVTEDGSVGVPVRWAGLPGADRVPFDAAFPFVVAPPSIDPSPLFTREVLLADEPVRQGKGEKPERERRGKASDKPDKPDRAEKPPRQRQTKKSDDDDEPTSKGQKGDAPRRGGKTKVVVIDKTPEIEVKPIKKKTKVVVVNPPKETKPKKTKQRGGSNDNGVEIMDGMGVALGLAGGIKIGGKGRGPKPGNDGPSNTMGGRSMGGNKN